MRDIMMMELNPPQYIDSQISGLYYSDMSEDKNHPDIVDV